MNPHTIGYSLGNIKVIEKNTLIDTNNNIYKLDSWLNLCTVIVETCDINVLLQYLQQTIDHLQPNKVLQELANFTVYIYCKNDISRKFLQDTNTEIKYVRSTNKTIFNYMLQNDLYEFSYNFSQLNSSRAEIPQQTWVSGDFQSKPREEVKEQTQLVCNPFYNEFSYSS